ncbi:hypothetical protein QQ055_00180 [Geitlerinema calcuttense NRMC-F 0142]|uniref:Uncharacterized protein n=2 Tax=Geitlerinema TaxID=63132 RepID=A0ABT7LX02_9CYAN|nr:hypothetical protein [Geitlerinema calcuttense NRMC-F 0142]
MDVATAVKYIPNVQSMPDMPYKQSWPLQAFKRVLRYAVENGYERVTIDTGETNAERYDLSKQVEKIEIEVPTETAGDVRFVDITTNDGNKINLEVEDGKIRESSEGQSTMVGKPLEDVVGKEMAEKIFNVPVEDSFATFSGNDLKVGGEGMKAFYDRILPAEINKYVKKWGGKVESGEIATTDTSGLHLEDYIVEEDVDNPGTFVVFHEGGDENLGDGFRTESEARAFIRDALGSPTNATVHSVEITPAMRESVMEGQPLFRSRSELAGFGESFRNAARQSDKWLLENVDTANDLLYQGDGILTVEDVAMFELIRRALGSYNARLGKTFSIDFDGMFQTDKTVKGFIDSLRKSIENAEKAGLDAKPLRDILKKFRLAARDNGTVILLLADEALPEEKGHRALFQNRASSQGTQVKVDNYYDRDVFQKALKGKFGRDYKGYSKAAQIEEFALKAALGQWNDLGTGIDKEAAADLAIDFLQEYAETSAKLRGVKPQEILDALAGEIAYAKELRDQFARRSEPVQERPPETQEAVPDSPRPEPEQRGEDKAVSEDGGDRQQAERPAERRDNLSLHWEKVKPEFESLAEEGYDPITLRDQADKALAFIQSNRPRAMRVVYGLEPPPKGLKQASVGVVMANALREAGKMEQAQTVARLTSQMFTDVAQELNIAKLDFGDPQRLIQAIEASRLQKLGKGLTLKEESELKKGRLKVGRRTAREAKAVMTEAEKIQTADELLEMLIC